MTSNSSYSISTLSAMVLAISLVSAITTAIGSPTYRALSKTRGGCNPDFISEPSFEWIIQPHISVPNPDFA